MGSLAGNVRLRRWAGIVILAVPALACSSTKEFEAIQAQLADVQTHVLQLQKENPTKDQVVALGTEVREQVQALLHAEADMRVEVEKLAAQIDQLESRLEDTNFRLQQLAQQIAATNQELQAFRDAALARATDSAPRSLSAPANVADPQSLYDTAYADFQRGNYDLAILGFRQYLEVAADTELADNATYWMGECYYRQGKYQKAASQFDEVITQFQRSERIASALLKKGYAYLELGQRAQGVVQLQHVMREFPGSDEAQLAEQRLAALGIDGGP